MFLNDDFLLTTPVAKTLFHEYAKIMPIVDYHCHLSPKEIYDDIRFENIADAWLAGDHYKWRIMRANGFDERLVTGDALPYDKFSAYVKSLSKGIGNPLYTWSHLELKRFFDIHDFMDESSVDLIWDQANLRLGESSFSSRELIVKSNVKVICTTDDPTDSLEYHVLLRNEEKRFKVLPTFRADAALKPQDTDFKNWICELEISSNMSIKSYDDMIQALQSRVNFFDEVGCKLSDHSLEKFNYVEADYETVVKKFEKSITGDKINSDELNQYISYTLSELYKMYHGVNWTTQLHLKAFRRVNTPCSEEIGPDSGFDAIYDYPIIESLQGLFDHLEKEETLGKTIVYSLDAKDFGPILALIGGFQGTYQNRIQLGSGWWFNDTREGMRTQLIEFANYSLLGNFVGMLTDSRSFLSYPRHEYFRRIVCELIGEWYERGEVHCDIEYLGKLVQDISFNNAMNFFGF